VGEELTSWACCLPPFNTLAFDLHVVYVYLNVFLPGVEFLILLMSTAVLDLKFIISQLKKEMFPPWLIAVT